MVSFTKHGIKAVPAVMARNPQQMEVWPLGARPFVATTAHIPLHGDM